MKKKLKEIVTHAEVCMNLDGIVLSEIDILYNSTSMKFLEWLNS